MATKTFYVCFASALLLQVIYAQCSCGNTLNLPSQINLGNQLANNNVGLGNQLAYNNVGLGNSLNFNNVGLGNSLGLNNNIGGFLPNNGAVINGINSGVSGLSISAQPGTFNVVSGSPAYAYPGGVSVTSNNEIGGAITVSGGLPFAGSAYFDGGVASNGQAGLSYSSGQGVGLSSSGCGVGLAGTQYIGSPVGVELGNVVGSGLSNAALINANSLNSGFNAINSGLSYAPSTCGRI